MSRSRRLRGPIHGQYHGAGLRISGHCADGIVQRSGHQCCERECGLSRRRNGHGPSSPRHHAVKNHHKISDRKRHCRSRRYGWFHQFRSSSAGHRQRSENSALHRRFRSHQLARSNPGGPEAGRPLCSYRSLCCRRHRASGEAHARSETASW